MNVFVILMVIAMLAIALGMCWISFKMLRETQAQAKKEHEQKIQKKD